MGGGSSFILVWVIVLYHKHAHSYTVWLHFALGNFEIEQRAVIHFLFLTYENRNFLGDGIQYF